MPKDMKHATSSPWEMNMALGKDFGTFISAMTGMKVEVDPNPAVIKSVPGPIPHNRFEGYCTYRRG